MDMATETEILDRALAGDTEAFDALVRHHYDRVYRCAFRFCRCQADAEDVAQEVFCRVAAKLHLFDRRSAFATWLYRITVNVAKDLLRKKSRHVAVPYENGNHGTEPGEDNPGAGKAVLAAIARLPDKLRETMVLVYGEELSHREAAKVLGCAETTVSWRIFKAKQQLKKLLSW